MELSARNYIETTVTAIKEGLVNAEIHLELKGGRKLASIITVSSAHRLGLKEGKTVYAVIKASNVIVGDFTGQLSARNVIPCKVVSIKKGKVSAEVSLNAGGQTLVSIITLDSCENMELTRGSKIAAIVKATDVIIAVD